MRARADALLLAQPDDDIPLTDAMRAYLRAFDRFVLAETWGERDAARVAKAAALNVMQNEGASCLRG